MLIVFIGASLLGVLLNYFDFFQSSVVFNYLLTTFYCASVLYMGNQARKEGEKGGKYLIIAMILYIIFWGLFTLSFTFGWGTLSKDVLFHVAILIVPIVVSALLGLDFKNTNNLLLINLEKVNTLSIEKQQILYAQNETLEQLVTRRTTELQHSLDNLKSTQSQLIQSEKMASLGELTAGIAHEIQNPLNFVNNFSEVSNELIDEMKEELEKGEVEEAKVIAADIKQNLEKINHHGKRADAIVKGMLQHSRTSSGQKEPTDINKLTDEYLRLAYHGLRAKDKTFNATMKTDFDENLPKINIVPQDIGRVILNLITNAFYACAERSRSAVNEKKKSFFENYDPTVWVMTKKEGNHILISVKDNGDGIPENVKDKIFQPFFTTKPTGEGTGLGLSLSYDTVRAHGGEITVETKEKEGTTFSIRLPVD